MATILLFGPNGQVGREIAGLVTEGDSLITRGREEADLSQPGAARSVIERHKPDIVINASAYTAVDKAEEERALCAQLNAHAPAEMAEAAAIAGAAFIHISTDYVFDGAGTTPLNEAAPTSPLCHYGTTKKAGEDAVLASGARSAILRTSWVYSVHGGNFVKTMLRLAETRDALTIVADQIGGPTPASAIAQTCLTIAGAFVASPDNDTRGGIYHFQGAPATSWADFARAIFEEASKTVAVTDIPTTDYPTPAIRPLYTVLDCSKIKQDFGIDQPNWRTDLKTTVQQLRAGV